VRQRLGFATKSLQGFHLRLPLPVEDFEGLVLASKVDDVLYRRFPVRVVLLSMLIVVPSGIWQLLRRPATRPMRTLYIG
jgi:hypothetical protein